MITIKNIREGMTEKYDVYLGKDSFIGQFCLVENEEEREAICKDFSNWFYQEVNGHALQDEIKGLRLLLKEHGKLNLFCEDYPKNCQANVVKTYLEDWYEGYLAYKAKIQDLNKNSNSNKNKS